MHQTRVGRGGRLPHSVLVVVDDTVELDQLARDLRQSYRVSLASSGAEALAKLSKLRQVDAILSDQRLPDMPGTELFRVLDEGTRDAHRIVKLLFAAREEVDGILSAAFVGQVDAFVPRPIDFGDLHRQLAFQLARRRGELRRSSRVRLDGQAHGIEDISEHGLLRKAAAPASLGSVVRLEVPLPDGTLLPLAARVVRVDREGGGVAYEFIDPTPYARKALRQLVQDRLRSSTLPAPALLPGLNTDVLVRFTERPAIEARLERVLRERVPICLHLGAGEAPALVQLASCRLSCSELTVAGEGLSTRLRTSETAFASFHLDGKTFFFETAVLFFSEDNAHADIVAPRALFYVDLRRSRRHPGGRTGEMVTIDRPGGEEPGRFPLIERTEGGFSFAAPPDSLFLPGWHIPRLRIVHGEATVLEGRGEIRHVTRVQDDKGAFYRVGVELGLGRRTAARLDDLPKVATVTPVPVAPSVPATAPAEPGWRERPVQVVRFLSSTGEEMVGLLNQAGPASQPAHAVVLPPAYGKKKETLVALALSICETFRAAGEPVAVLRYDGVRRRGESYHDPGCEAPHNQMVRATLGQGAADLRAAIRYCENNPRFKATSVSLVAFSLSAIETRLLLRDPEIRARIRQVVLAMGIPDLRTTLVRASGGIDRVENYRLGIPMGVVPMLGYRVDADHFLRDAFAHDLVDFQRAQADFASLDVPVTWMYGAHDGWVDVEQVRRLMDVEAPAPRELVECKLGHAAHSSEEALEMFGRIAQLLLRRCAGRVRAPLAPCPEDLAFVMQSERDRAPSALPKSPIEYWRDYLLGDQSLSYDIFWFSDDYLDLMQKQLEMLEVGPEHRVAELGAGTGNFTAYLLKNLPQPPRELLVSDLVPEALQVAAGKAARVLAERGLSFKPRFEPLDLELNRYEPIRDWIQGKLYSVKALVGAVEGLGAQAADAIAARWSQRMYDLTRGAPLAAADQLWLESQLDLEPRQVVLDLNQAAAVLQGRLPAAEARYRVLRLPPDPEAGRRLPLPDGAFDRIALSLVLSYLHQPERTLREVARVLRPGGVLVASTMIPDADFSGAFRAIIEKLETQPDLAMPFGWTQQQGLEAARQLLHDASGLADLENDGVFHFFGAAQLRQLLEGAGFTDVRVEPSFGNPPQALIARARKQDS